MENNIEKGVMPISENEEVQEQVMPVETLDIARPESAESEKEFMARISGLFYQTFMHDPDPEVAEARQKQIKNGDFGIVGSELAGFAKGTLAGIGFVRGDVFAKKVAGYMEDDAKNNTRLVLKPEDDAAIKESMFEYLDSFLRPKKKSGDQR